MTHARTHKRFFVMVCAARFRKSPSQTKVYSVVFAPLPQPTTTNRGQLPLHPLGQWGSILVRTCQDFAYVCVRVTLCFGHFRGSQNGAHLRGFEMFGSRKMSLKTKMHTTQFWDPKCHRSNRFSIFSCSFPDPSLDRFAHAPVWRPQMAP